MNNVTGDSSEENGGNAEQRKRQFQPAPIYDALEIDWESLMRKSGHVNQTDDSLEQSGDKSTESSAGI